MHWTSKLAVWLTGLNLFIAGWYMSRVMTFLDLKEKGLVTETFFRESNPLNSAFWQMMYMTASMICGIWILHGKQSRNPKHIPIFELVVNILILGSRIWDMIPG